MTEYEQLQQLLTTLGVPHTAMILTNPIYQPAQEINIAGAELWFNSRGQFLHVRQENYDDYRETIFKQRTYTPGFVFEEDVKEFTKGE